MKMFELVDNWKDGLRFWSVRLNLLGIAIIIAEQFLQTWALVTPEARALLPGWLSVGAPLACFALATVARIVRQRKLYDEQQAKRAGA